ncbi:hypothetical protein BDV96DRAFT_485190 [Lophiotrema nucula]|uniref:Luciferase domain-containing protein n=1 Tax=Lophiotrema nucula TaxID=690887 RepID=A0A6A5ZMP0_9PLEO|nr:hypothetical protein BDV96DRAFT_485190 [Lophiotrema nucula]
MADLLHLPPPPLLPTSLPSILNSPLLQTLFTLSILALATVYIQHDYHKFLALGPGGTPATPLGYLKIKLLSLVCLRDPYRPLPVPPHFRPQRGYLSPSTLHTRPGKRPLVQGIAPQRQRSQKSSADIYARLVRGLRALAKEPRNRLMERTSCFEKHSSGLFASTPITRTCGGEICHAHPSDGSLHMTLHPADAKLVLENRWGERHPLAKGGWFRRFVPREFVLIYAPRSEEEVDVVLGIVAAGVWWVSGVDVRREENVKDRGLSEEDMKKAKEENECWACRLHGCGEKSREKMVADA